MSAAPALQAPASGRQRLSRAASWLLGSSLASQGLRLLSSLLLTRWLMPDAFGLVAALQTLYLGLVLLSDLGVWQSVVNARQAHAPTFLGTAWSVQLARAVLLSLVILALAAALALVQRLAPGWLGGIYAEAQLPAMLAAFIAVALVQGLESMKLALAQRALQTREIARIELFSQALGVVITLALARWQASPWALIAGALASAASRSALSHLVLPGPRVRPCWDQAHARELVGFGKWIALSSVIGFAAAHGEKMVLAGLLSAAGFGLYAIAAALLAAVIGVISMINGHLVFPALSEALRESPERMLALYRRAQRLADTVLGLVAGLLLATGHWVVDALYDPRYAGAGPMLQLLALGLLGLRLQVLEQMMFARGRADWVTLGNALRALVIVAGIPLAHGLWGLQGGLGAVVLAQFAAWPSALAFKRRMGLPLLAGEGLWPLALLAGAAAGWATDRLLSAAVAWLG